MQDEWKYLPHKGGVLEDAELRVLLAEDNPKDVTVFRSVARRGDLLIALQVVHDGETALDFLYRRGQWSEVWRPDFVVLNINMPKLNGWEVLKAMKSAPDLRTIPVAMWTIADPAYADYAARSFEMGCSCGFSKPHAIQDMQSQVRTMLEYHYHSWRYPRNCGSK